MELKFELYGQPDEVAVLPYISSDEVAALGWQCVEASMFQVTV